MISVRKRVVETRRLQHRCPVRVDAGFAVRASLSRVHKFAFRQRVTYEFSRDCTLVASGVMSADLIHADLHDIHFHLVDGPVGSPIPVEHETPASW